MFTPAARTARVVLYAPLPLLLCYGCMTVDALDRKVTKGEVQTSESFRAFSRAATDDRRIYICYDVNVNERLVERCAEWDRDLVTQAAGPTQLRGSTIAVDLLTQKSAERIALIFGGDTTGTKQQSTVIVVPDPKRNLAVIRLGSPDGNQVVRQVEAPLQSGRQPAWTYVARPFAWLIDIVTFPFQAIWFLTHFDATTSR